MHKGWGTQVYKLIRYLRYAGGKAAAPGNSKNQAGKVVRKGSVVENIGVTGFGLRICDDLTLICDDLRPVCDDLIVICDDLGAICADRTLPFPGV
ncbi:MAG TPA: hypothetical protein VG649_12685, partial [Candidatus Angelobacter sp.]|nr:hypothetical protein [Candidatus Angelobacter sp.]